MKRALTFLLVATALVACADAYQSSGAPRWDASSGIDGGAPPNDAGTGRDGSAQEDGGLSPDASASADSNPVGIDASAADAPPPPPCQVLLRPVSAPDLGDLPAGPGEFVRVRGEIVGGSRPIKPQWDWRVSFYGESVSVVDPESSDPSLIRLPLDRPGDYVIDVSVSPECTGRARAKAMRKDQRRTNFILRLVPPPTSGLPPQDVSEQLLAGTPKQADIRLAAGQDVAIIPYRADAVLIAPPLVPAFVRIYSRATSFEREGEAKGPMGYQTRLGSGLYKYNVLIVPQDTALAPLLLRDYPASSLRELGVPISAGVNVQGRVTVAGTALAGARVMLRDQDQPSTLGVSGAAGSFSLRARSGAHVVRVVGPPEVALPVLEGEPFNPVEIGSETNLQMNINYIELATANLNLVAMRPGGVEPAAGTVVQISSDPIPNAGTLVVDPKSPRALAGHVEFTAVTNGQGRVVFPPLPRAHYHVLLRPPSDRSWAAAYQTPITVDLREGDKTMIEQLASAVIFRSKLAIAQDTPAGLRVAATEETANAVAEEAFGIVAADGSFTLNLSPHTTYRLRVVPPLGRLVPQVGLGSIQTLSGDTSYPPFRQLPPALRFTGRVFDNLNRPLPGTVLQAFCNNERPDCIDSSRPSVGVAVPISEAVAGPDGSFVLVLPDPSG